MTLRRLAQQEERQERHERLVEVEHVEPLALEQVADLADVARRERQRPDRAVDRHAEADADADDVALRRALRAVAGGDDPHVVAAQAEVLVEEPDVLGDAARLRVDVRADEADLHRRSAAPRVRFVAGRPGAAAGVAVVAARAVAADPAGDLVARVAAALAQLVAERADLAGRPVERAVVLGRAASRSRGAGRAASRPGNVVQPVPIAVERVGVAVADMGEPVLVGEADDPACHGCRAWSG